MTEILDIHDAYSWPQAELVYGPLYLMYARLACKNLGGRRMVKFFPAFTGQTSSTRQLVNTNES
jgi:hypothetical protein